MYIGFRVVIMSSLVVMSPIVACKNAETSSVKIVGANADEATTATARKSTFYLHPEFCTGTLTDVGIAGYERRVLVTAAHCKSSGLDMQVSNQNLGDNPSAMSVSGKLTPHPEWDGDLRNDIGIVILDEPAPSEWVPVPVSSSVPVKGKEVVLAGFGDTKLRGTWPTEALAVKTKIESFDEAGLIIYRSVGLGGECHGDSGGPMFVQNNGALEVIGATHGGYEGMKAEEECATSGSYTYIKPYLPWIGKVIEAHRAGGPTVDPNTLTDSTSTESTSTDSTSTSKSD